MKTNIYVGDACLRLAEMPTSSIQCCVTSPPYWGLRDYGHNNQLGLEATPEEYINNMVVVFREVRRVLADDGVLWLNLGDSYASASKGTGGASDKQSSNPGSFYNPIKLKHGLKQKDLVGIPWRVALALQADGWYLRQDIIWHKPNPMPESVRDRCTKAHEYVFMLTKSSRYYFDNKAIAEPVAQSTILRIGQPTFDRQEGGYRVPGKTNGPMKAVVAGATRNKRSVWSITTKPFKDAHFAVMPEALVEPCVLATSRSNDTVLDPFMGAGTTGVVANRHSRHFVGIELNPQFVEIAKNRILNDLPMMNTVDIHL